MNVYLRYLLSLPKSIWFNLRYLPLSQAIKLPFYIRYGTKIRIDGKVIIEDSCNLKIGMIVIGSHESDVSDPKHTTCITVKKNGTLKFQRTAHIGLGTKIHVDKNATMYLGDNFAVSAKSDFVCYKSIVMGRDIQFSWDCLVMDSDTHSILDDNKKVINYDHGIIIEDKVWIGCRVTIMKGTHIPQNCVIGASSFVSGSKFDSNSLILGIPARSAKYINSWSLAQPGYKINE